MAKLTIQIPSTTYTHNRTSSLNPSPLPSSSSAVEVSSSTRSSTYPYSQPPPSPCSTDSDSDSMLSLEYADAPPSPIPHYGASANHHDGIVAHSGPNSSPRKRSGLPPMWERGSGSSPNLQAASSSNSWVPRANCEAYSESLPSSHQVQADRGRLDHNANLPLPNPHPPPSKTLPNPLSNLANPLPYPRTPSASSSTSSKSTSSASTNSNSSSYITSASSTSAADYLKPPSSPRGFTARTPSPLGERRGKTPSQLSSNAALAPAPRHLSHRTSSPSPLSATFFSGGHEAQPPQALDSGKVHPGDPSFFSNRAASPSKRPLSHSSSFVLDTNGNDQSRPHEEYNAFHGMNMPRSESPVPMDDTPKASGKVRLIGNSGNAHADSLPLPLPSPTKSASYFSPSPQHLARPHTPHSFSQPTVPGHRSTRSDHDLGVPPPPSPGPRPHSRNGTRLPVPPTLMPAHHRNSSSTSIVSTMGGFNGGISGGMAAGSRPLSGSISDLTFGGPSPTSANFPPSAYAPNGPRPGHSSGSFASRAGSFDSNALGLEHHRTGSSVSSRGGYAPSVATGMGQGLEHQRTGSFSGRGHRRTGSSGSWVPASAFEGGAGLMPPPPRRSSHVRSHSCDHLSQPQPPRREKKEEDIIFTGFGGVGKPAPSPSPSPTTTSFPQSRPLPVPVPRHPSRSSSSFVPPQRPYSAMGYPPSFTHSEAHLRSQSTGGLSMMAGTDPNFYVGAQSTGSASWIGSQPTGTYSLPPCTIPEGSVESASPAKPSVVADATPAGRKKLTKSSPSRREGSRSPSKEGSPTKSGGFKIFGRKKGKGIVNGDGVFVAGIGANVTPEDKKKEKRSSSPLKKLGLSLRSLSPKKGQDSPTKQTEALIWSAK